MNYSHFLSNIGRSRRKCSAVCAELCDQHGRPDGVLYRLCVHSEATEVVRHRLGPVETLARLCRYFK